MCHCSLRNLSTVVYSSESPDDGLCLPKHVNLTIKTIWVCDGNTSISISDVHYSILFMSPKARIYIYIWKYSYVISAWHKILHVILHLSVLLQWCIYLYTYISVSDETYCLLLLLHWYMFRLYMAIRYMSTLPKLFHYMLKLHTACECNLNY